MKAFFKLSEIYTIHSTTCYVNFGQFQILPHNQTRNQFMFKKTEIPQSSYGMILRITDRRESILLQMLK